MSEEKANELRQQAEARLAAAGDDAPDMSVQDSRQLIHALRTHQIELEMQNEELRRAEQELSDARDRFADLYDFAPVGYVTISDKGLILQVNLTLSRLFGVERGRMMKRRFSSFVAAQESDSWYLHMAAILKGGDAAASPLELTFKRQDGSFMCAVVNCLRVQQGDQVVVRLSLTDISGRKLRDERIRKLSAAVEQSPSAIIITDADGSIEFVNAAFTRLSGYAAEEVIGKNPRLLRSGKMPAGVFEEMWQNIRAGRTWEHEICNRRKDGSLYWDAVSISPLKNEQGDITHFVAIQTDITEQKRLAGEKKKFAAQYRSLYENMLDVYYRTDKEGRVVAITPSCLAQTGYTQEEILGRNVSEFYADPSMREPLLSELFQNGSVNDFEVILVRKDGVCRTVSVTGSLLLDDARQPVGIEGILRDITGRKQTEAELRTSEGRLNMAQRIAQVGHWQLDLKTNRLIWSDEVFRIFELDPACFELSYEHFLDAVHPDDREAVSQAYRQSLVTRQPYSIEHRLLLQGGRIKWVREQCESIFASDGAALHSRGTVQDITSDRSAAEARALLLQENRRLVRQLMQVQEEERRLLARDLHDQLGQLLTSIDARAEYIARHAGNDELRTIAMAIVRDTAASFDASHTTLMKLRPATLDTLGLSAALTELSSHWKRSGINCSLHIDGAIDQLDEMHAIAIFRLVQEGLTNARRHGEADRAEISVRLTPKDRGQAIELLVEVSDNGKGLQAQSISEGMGIIGMRERVNALGGTFRLTDVPGGGARIEATMPLDAGEVVK